MVHAVYISYIYEWVECVPADTEGTHVTGCRIDKYRVTVRLELSDCVALMPREPRS